MTGPNASPFTPLSVGYADTGDQYDSWLGRQVQIGAESFVVVKCGPAIAASSQGKQLVTALSAGVPDWVVSLATGLADPKLCGAIPSTLTAAIVSGTYFLALRDSPNHQLLVLGSTTGSAAITGGAYVGALLMSNTGSTLGDVFGAATSASVTGTTLDIYYAANSAGQCLQIQTGTAATQTYVRYRAPFRGG